LRHVFFALGLLASLSSGCAPSCDRVCDKVIACGLDSPRTSQDACVEDCDRQAALYDEWWDDQVKVDAFKEHKRCVMDATCDELAAGACYDPLLFIFAEPS